MLRTIWENLSITCPYKKKPVFLDLGLLGESRGSLLVGNLSTPLGELSISCTYRRLLGFGHPSNTPSYETRSMKVCRFDSGSPSTGSPKIPIMRYAELPIGIVNGENAEILV